MERIKLIVMNGTAYVWSVEDWMKIRELRIVGNFIGSLASLPRQNQLAGLPLALLKEETSLLLEKGLAVTKSVVSLSESPSEHVQEESRNCLEKLSSEQMELMKEKRKQEIESKIDIILEGKRAKKRCLEEGQELTRERVLEEEFQKLQPIKPSALSVQICTEDPWVEEDNYKDYSWEYPKNKAEHLHYSIFKDLWEKGYYITPGEKFGGDYLAYPGDPVKFHAFFIIICLERDKKLTMSEIITYGRLANSVRKTCVFGYLDKNDAVAYQSIQWAGF